MTTSSINPHFLEACTILLITLQTHFDRHLEGLHSFTAVDFQLVHKCLGIDLDLRHETNFRADDVARNRILLAIDSHLRHPGHLMYDAFNFSRVDLLPTHVDDFGPTP